ncbi:hypothetical protein [Elioraea sp.]|uniref:hypothetical protein n=1 Tax=Elioraea sp. TaxID=2185103 RepID=UPI0025C1ED9E|nr:hypothetical protein [Elioraea sp.]
MPKPGRGRWPLAVLVVVVIALGVAAGLVWQRPWEGPAPPPPEAVGPSPPRLAAVTASPATILASRGTALTVFSIDMNPSIYVFDFPTLSQQGEMLNRIAALVEKAGLPRDRVLDDAALAAAIAAAGETVETFYYGHNYRASHLVRFFTLAASQGVTLNAEERRLAAILADLGAVALGADGLPRLVREAAIITVPGLHAADPARGRHLEVDEAVRGVILRHELSHGEFFTNNAYAAHVKTWWNERLSARERTQLRRFLAEGGYDPDNEEVMMNEAMAYIVHTPDERFFSAASVGMDQATLDRLRARFKEGLPETWLSHVTWP